VLKYSKNFCPNLSRRYNRVCLEFGAYGVNVAHTGTAVGIFMDEKIDEFCIIERLTRSKIIEIYGKYFVTRMVKGGPRVLDIIPFSM